MKELPDDLLALIIDRIDNTNDRKSLSLVNKQWLRVEGTNRSSLVVHDHENLTKFLPRFPNLLSFQAPITIPNSLLQFLADTCPKVQVLNLNYKERVVCEIKNGREDDIDNVGLSHIAKKCPDLETVLLRRRYGIGNLGVISLGQFSTKLKTLDLSSCTKVSDEALESIGGLTNLEVLILDGCFLITDHGLGFLGQGYACNTLMKLNIAECDRITDKGLMHLGDMACLVDLNVSECGPRVMEWGGEKVVEWLFGLRRLNLSNLDNACDKTLIALAQYCWDLEALNLTGCDSVTGEGIRAFTTHGYLKELVLRHCISGISIHDIKELVLGCSSLECIFLDKSLRSWMTLSMLENLGKCCVLEWQ